MTNSNSSKFFNRFTGKYIRISVLSLIILLCIYLAIDYMGPDTIKLKPDIAFGMGCMRAGELIVQEYDKKGNLWASRGMIIYKLEKGDDKFIKVAHVPTGLNLFWFRNFTFVRKLTVRPECIEMVTTGKGDICALSAGKLWHMPPGAKRFKETIRIRHYGIGDQGVRNDGIVSINDSILYFAEYFRNSSKEDVHVLQSKDGGVTWHTVYKFKPGQVRHIHSVQHDSYTGKNWLCTGDADSECMIAWTEDSFRNITPIGSGTQIYRACQLVFAEDNIYWGTDTGRDKIPGIYKWNRKTLKLIKLIEVQGAVFFGTRLNKGTIIFSTNREGMPNEKDDKTRIFVLLQNDSVATIEAGTWKSKKPGFRFKFAQLRFQRDQGSSSLAVTCLNQKEIPDGDLILISEDTLIKAARLNSKISLHPQLK